MAPESVDASDGVVRHGEFCPSVTMKAASGREGHEIMTTLFVPGRAQTNSTNRPGHHVVGVLFVSLYIAAKFEANMLAIIEMLASEEIS